MSEDRTSKIDTANSESAELHSSGVDQNDSGLVDRTQQLIDEVNQLLGTDDPSPEATTPESTAQEAEAETTSNEIEDDLSDSAATLKNFLDSLVSDESEESEPQADSEPQAESDLDAENVEEIAEDEGLDADPEAHERGNT